MQDKKVTISLTGPECTQIYVLLHFHLCGEPAPTEDPMILRTLDLIFQDLMINEFFDEEKEAKVV